MLFFSFTTVTIYTYPFFSHNCLDPPRLRARPVFPQPELSDSCLLWPPSGPMFVHFSSDGSIRFSTVLSVDCSGGTFVWLEQHWHVPASFFFFFEICRSVFAVFFLSTVYPFPINRDGHNQLFSIPSPFFPSPV